MVSACHDGCVICGNLILIASIDVLFPSFFSFFTLSTVRVYSKKRKSLRLRAMGMGVQFFIQDSIGSFSERCAHLCIITRLGFCIYMKVCEYTNKVRFGLNLVTAETSQCQEQRSRIPFPILSIHDLGFVSACYKRDHEVHMRPALFLRWGTFEDVNVWSSTKIGSASWLIHHFIWGVCHCLLAQAFLLQSMPTCRYPIHQKTPAQSLAEFNSVIHRSCSGLG